MCFVGCCLFSVQTFVGKGGGAGASVLLSPGSSCHSPQQVAQLLPLPVGVHLRAHPLLDELVHALVFGHSEQLRGTLLMGMKSHTSWIMSRTNLVSLVRPPVVPTVLGLADVPCHLVTLVETHSHGITQGHGCCSLVAAATTQENIVNDEIQIVLLSVSFASF